ncbi:Trafficking protein particle complex subunit 11 [Globisporangium polare]
MTPHWKISPRLVNSASKSMSLCEAARYRLEELNRLREQLKKHFGSPYQQKHQPRVNNPERSCFEILRQLYATHGSIAAIDARQLVPVYEAVNSFREPLETFSYNANKITRF